MFDVYYEDVESLHFLDFITLWDNSSDTTVLIKQRLGVEMLAAVIINFDSKGIEDYDEMVCELYGMVHTLMHQTSLIWI